VETHLENRRPRYPASMTGSREHKGNDRRLIDPSRSECGPGDGGPSLSIEKKRTFLGSSYQRQGGGEAQGRGTSKFLLGSKVGGSGGKKKWTWKVGRRGRKRRRDAPYKVYFFRTRVLGF